MSSFEDRQRDLLQPYLSRRAVMRGVGLLGLGAIGAALPGCKGRPEEDIIDTSTDPELVQLGGTITGVVTGLLEGLAVGAATVDLGDLGTLSTDRNGNFELRAQRVGVFPVSVTAGGYVQRSGQLRLQGNVSLSLTLLERDAGLKSRFLEEYARGVISSGGVQPRTPGFTNRWTSTPRVEIYRKYADDTKTAIPDERVEAMQTAVAALFGPLTAFRLGTPAVTVRNGAPPEGLGDVPTGVIAVAQSQRRPPRMVHAGAVDSPYAIGKARTECRADAPIELFNRMFAHTLGAWLVNASESIVNVEGLASPSESDLLAAEFVYNRQPGNGTPDEDPPGAFLNA